MRSPLKPIDQRRLRPGAEVADRIGRARRNCDAARGAERGGPPKPPSPRQNIVCVTVAIEFAGRLIGDLAFGEDQRALAGALVDDLDDALRPITVPAAGSGRCSVMPCSPLTTLTQSMPVSRSRIQKPGMAEHGRPWSAAL